MWAYPLAIRQSLGRAGGPISRTRSLSGALRAGASTMRCHLAKGRVFSSAPSLRKSTAYYDPNSGGIARERTTAALWDDLRAATPFFVVAGPCAAESADLCLEVAEQCVQDPNLRCCGPPVALIAHARAVFPAAARGSACPSCSRPASTRRTASHTIARGARGWSRAWRTCAQWHARASPSPPTFTRRGRPRPRPRPWTCFRFLLSCVARSAAAPTAPCSPPR